MRALVVLVLIPCAIVVATAPAQEKKDPPKVEIKGTIYAVQKGKDVIVYLPKGLDYDVLESPTIKVKPKIVQREDGGYVFEDRIPAFVPTQKNKATFMLSGTVNRKIEIGGPTGYVFSFDDPPKK